MTIDIQDRRNFILRWANMLDRCDNPKCESYHRYGGRGIKVCDEWYDFFQYLKDLPDDYFQKAELDRINNNSGYCPSNVRWSTKKVNCNNRSSSRYIEFKGKKKSITEWAEEIGINPSSLAERLDNWSLKDALTLPKGTRLHNRWDGHTKPNPPKQRELRLYMFDGKQHTMKQLSKISGIPPKLLRKRINERGWKIERALETMV